MPLIQNTVWEQQKLYFLVENGIKKLGTKVPSFFYDKYIW